MFLKNVSKRMGSMRIQPREKNRPSFVNSRTTHYKHFLKLFLLKIIKKKKNIFKSFSAEN